MAAILQPQVSLPLRPSVQFYDLHPPVDDFRAEVIYGLSQPQKAIAPKFLYDQSGASLFDDICTLDEYYLTRTEMAILRSHAAEIADLIGHGVLIEFGSGSSAKVRILLDASPRLSTYVALDISKRHLYNACFDLVADYPQLSAIALCTDYTQPIQLPDSPELRHHKVGFFPGSSIGNLEPDDAIRFLKHTTTLLRSGGGEPGGGLIIGVDLKKDAAILEPAYDDDRGISAAFALNLLDRINRELGANFDRTQFGYRAVYNPDDGRIEMYIVSLVDQVVQLGAMPLVFAQGETLRTEYSYKYTVAEFQDLALQAGFRPHRVWVDPQQLFSVHYLTLE